MKPNKLKIKLNGPPEVIQSFTYTLINAWQNHVAEIENTKKFYSVKDIAKILPDKKEATIRKHIREGILIANPKSATTKAYRISHQNLQNYRNL